MNSNETLYQVTVTINPSHSALLRVAAESADQANERAMAMARAGKAKYELDEDSVFSADPYLPDPDSTEVVSEEDPTVATRYFVGRLTEVNGELEYAARFVFHCAGDADPDERLQEIFCSFRDDNGEPDEDGFVHNEDGTGLKNPSKTEVPLAEYEVLRRHLTSL